MAILIISGNPLFTEAVSETLTLRLESELLTSSPEQALEFIQKEQAEVLLVDEAIPPDLLKKILKQAKRLNKTRLILLSCTGNNFIVLDSYQATIGSVEDLVSSIREKELEQADSQKSMPESFDLDR
jgi:hypothetical protein